MCSSGPFCKLSHISDFVQVNRYICTVMFKYQILIFKMSLLMTIKIIEIYVIL